MLKDYSDNYEAIMYSDDGDNDSPSIKESYKYEVLDPKSKNEEINRILVSLSSIFSESIFKTLLSLDKEDMQEQVKKLAPILISLTVSDQLPFRLRLRELLNVVWKIGIKE